jgi:preprotein translocase subunit YajC
MLKAILFLRMLPMNTFIIPLLMAAPQGGGADGAAPGGSLITSFLPFIAIIAIFYFLIIRPQNKKRKETDRMLSALKKGDKVVTIGGLHGTIQSVKESTVIIKADDNVKLEFLRSAVSSVVQPSASKEDKIEEKTEGNTSENGE